MKLSQHIIFYRLSKTHGVRYTVLSEAPLAVDRPVFYQSGMTLQNHLVLVSALELESIVEQKKSVDGCLFISCDRAPAVTSLKGCCVLAFNTSTDTHDVFNKLQLIYDLFDAWDNSMKDILHENGTFQNLIDSTEPIMFDPIAVADDAFRYIAYAKALSKERGLDKYVGKDNYATFEAFSDIIDKEYFASLAERKDTFTIPSEGAFIMSRNIFEGGKFRGRLILQFFSLADGYLLSYNSQILEHLHVYAEKLFSKYHSFDQQVVHLDYLHTLIVETLTDYKVSEALWSKAYKENGWELTDRLQSVQFKNKRYDKETFAVNFGQEMERIWRGCAFYAYNNRLMLLVNLDRYKAPDGIEFRQALACFLRDNLLVAGLSRIFTDISGLKPSCEQTETALEIGVRKNPTFWYHKFDDYAVYYMLENSRGSYRSKDICSQKVLILRRHDEQKGSEYLKTLRTYIDCKFNAAETARKLYIHRSSFLGRIERIQELVSLDFDNPQEILYLTLSLEVMNVHSDD